MVNKSKTSKSLVSAERTRLRKRQKRLADERKKRMNREFEFHSVMELLEYLVSARDEFKTNLEHVQYVKRELTELCNRCPRTRIRGKSPPCDSILHMQQTSDKNRASVADFFLTHPDVACHAHATNAIEVFRRTISSLNGDDLDADQVEELLNAALPDGQACRDVCIQSYTEQQQTTLKFVKGKTRASANFIVPEALAPNLGVFLRTDPILRSARISWRKDLVYVTSPLPNPHPDTTNVVLHVTFWINDGEPLLFGSSWFKSLESQGDKPPMEFQQMPSLDSIPKNEEAAAKWLDNVRAYLKHPTIGVLFGEV